MSTRSLPVKRFVLVLLAAGVLASGLARAEDVLPARDNGVPANTERMDYAGANHAPDCRSRPEPKLPFAISVDGEAVDAGAGTGPAGAQRCTDVALQGADIRIRFDAGETKRALAIEGWRDEGASGDVLRFSIYSNYAPFIDHAEIRLFRTSDSTLQQPLQVVPAPVYGLVETGLPRLDDKELAYVLRVYDADGAFDETRARTLVLAARRDGPPHNPLAVYGEDMLALHNIAVSGGTVTVDGSRIRPGERVTVMGYQAPVDRDGQFAFRQIMPAGPQQVDVKVAGAQGEVAEFSRSMTIPDQDWFYVGLADLMLGRNRAKGPVDIVRADAGDKFDDKVWVNGRLAFYLKGKIKGEYLLTAAADTRDGPIKDIFSNFSSKDPHYLLRRLDPEKYYPVYGDDSTAVEDAPTRGKFYVRLEKGESHVLWGDFHTSIDGTDFMQFHRGLYGGKLKWVSEATTSHGERKARVDAFAAEPGTLPARDEFRGTAGSLYYLRRQDVTQGSEKVTVEVRDKDTGIVLKTTTLLPETDYEINYLQGRILLMKPLGSTVDDDGLVRTGSLSGHKQYLVVTYEYTPGLSRSEDATVGGRASLWADDHIMVGATGYKQQGIGVGQTAGGLDAVLRYKPGTYVKGEIARSEGVGSGASLSIDGGYSFLDQKASGELAYAKRIEAAADLAEIDPALKGRLNGYWQDKDKGFSTPGNLTGGERATEGGVGVDVPLDPAERTKVRLKASKKDGEYSRTDAGEGAVEYKVDENWTLIIGARADQRQRNTVRSTKGDGDGNRVDAASRLEYRPDTIEGKAAPWMVYGFGQATVAKTGSRLDNNRGGAGGETQLTEAIKAKGELSEGSGGFGALVGLDYAMDADTTLYLNYRLDTDRTDGNLYGHYGTATLGGRTRFNDNVGVFAEERYYHGEGPSGLAHGFGLDFSPADKWTVTFSGELGRLEEERLGTIDRKAGGGSIAYARDGFRYMSSLEGRYDDSAQGEHRTLLSRNKVNADLTDEWRILTSFSGSWSQGSEGAFYDSDFIEGVTAFAYRPIFDDKLNMLFKYTYFQDVPTAGQLDDYGYIADYAQRSNVLAIDADYDLIPPLTIGGKYAVRIGELRENRVDGEWFSNIAQLGIVRGDLHFVKDWDFTLEGRVLDVEDADTRVGALAAVYRHIGDNLKLGAGYNFADFSDDLTDLDYNHRGFMVNVIGKF
jgi:hypothetical protein